MNDIERALRRALRDQPPVHADPRLVKAVLLGIRKRRRAVLAATAGGTATAAGAAVVIILALIGTRGAPGGANPAAAPAGGIPWTNRTAPVYTPPPARSLAAPTAKYAACTASDLTGKAGDVSLGTGRITQYIVLSNTGAHPCTLSGAPSTLVGVRANGIRTTLATGSTTGTQSFGLTGPANLRPGQSAQVAIATTDMCSAASTGGTDDYSTVTVRIGTSGAVNVSLPRARPLNVICGAVGVSAFGVPGTSSDQSSSPLNVLTASAAMPGTVTAGTTARYTVTLHNPTGQAVALSRCPSYMEFMSPLGTMPGSGASRYYLNCQAVSIIPAGGSVTFDMQISVPGTTGDAKYGWALQGTSVQTGGSVTITGP